MWEGMTMFGKDWCPIFLLLKYGENKNLTDAICVCLFC